LANQLTLEAGTRQVRFGFTAASLGMPERVRFKYKLSGVDDDWRISQVRNTTYTNLGPGNYTFAVMAANASGVWSATPASINFSIAPMFWQTAWFRALGIAVLMALLSGLYRWRLGLHARRTQERTEVRLAERERIAQDLHDTLLQGVQALSWKFERLIAQLPGGTRLRTEMEDALGLAERLVDEGRDSVHGLRAPRARSELGAAITAYAGQLAAEPSPMLSCAVEQLPRALREQAWQELFRIGCEACSNALRHAQATVIRVSVNYGDDGLSLCISDDGIGFVPPLAAANVAGRRWGMVGMHERAARLGGVLQVDSTSGHGTSIRLKISANLAYVRLRPESPDLPDRPSA
jgi:signal transduction histidine kinase